MTILVTDMIICSTLNLFETGIIKEDEIDSTLKTLQQYNPTDLAILLLESSALREKEKTLVLFR